MITQCEVLIDFSLSVIFSAFSVRAVSVLDMSDTVTFLSD